MATRFVTSISRVAVCKSTQHHLHHQFNPFSTFSPYHRPRYFFSLPYVLCKVFDWKSVSGSTNQIGSFDGPVWIRSNCLRNIMHKAAAPVNKEDVIAADGKTTVKKKKLKGKREVVRFMKFFRYKKKKEFERMTTEEKILYKLKKARNKETRLMTALKKLEPSDPSSPIHDPEILTPEEHFYFLKMGVKSKNYVPVGRRGIYQGVILNMHLHWKKHQTLKVVVKTFTPEEVKEIAAELARLSGGIVLDIQDDDTIIMYRGKNYSQPPTEIMSPKISLPRIKALNKSKYRDGLRAVRKFIPRLEHDLELLQELAKRKHESGVESTDYNHETEICERKHGLLADQQQQRPYDGKERMGVSSDLDDDSTTESGLISESECLSDIFETDSEKEVEEKTERPLYLDAFEKFPALNNEEPDDFDEHLRQISLNSKKDGRDDVDLPDLDEVDRIFLRAESLLKQKRR